MLLAFTAIADDIERMANHMVNPVDLARTNHSAKIAFTDAAMGELHQIETLVGRNIEDALQLIIDRAGDRVAAITEREDEVDVAVRESRDRHLIRLHERQCPAEAGPVFLEILIHLERISDHCQNIAEHLE